MRPVSLQEHIAVLTLLVVVLVAGLIYSISPGEVDLAWAAARTRAAGEAESVWAQGAQLSARLTENLPPVWPPAAAILAFGGLAWITARRRYTTDNEAKAARNHAPGSLRRRSASSAFAGTDSEIRQTENS